MTYQFIKELVLLMMFGMRVLDKPQINWVLNGLWLAIELKAKVKNLKIGIMRNKYVNEDGTPFSKEEFLQKLKTDKEFNNEFGNKGIDQISELIRLLKENPDSRRMVVNAWNPSDLPNQVLPPCHYGFQVYTRELSTEERKEILYNKFRKGPIIVNGESYVECAPTDINFEFFNIPKRAISLMWNQRSVDTFLGLPFNIASYGLLLEIIAKETNMVPEELIGNLGDVHLYQNHLEQAREQIVREPYALPKLICKDEYWYLKDIDIPFTEKIKRFQPDFFKVEDYQSHLTIKAPLSN